MVVKVGKGRRRVGGGGVGPAKGDVAVVPFFRDVAPVSLFGLSADC